MRWPLTIFLLVLAAACGGEDHIRFPAPPERLGSCTVLNRFCRIECQELEAMGRVCERDCHAEHDDCGMAYFQWRDCDGDPDCEAQWWDEWGEKR